jgi:SPP1 gp7 family putative phage head morphogenesis protein
MDELTEAQLSHEIYLNKLSKFYGNKFDEIEPEILKAIRLAYSEFDSIDTKADVNALNDRIEELLTPILDEFVAEQEKAIDELAEQEVNFQADLMQIMGINLTAQSIAQAIALSRQKYRTTLIVINDEGVDVKKRLESYTKNTLSQIRDINLGSYTRKESVEETRKTVTGTRKNKYTDGYLAKMKRNIQTLTNTARKHQEIQAKIAVFKKSGSDGYVLTAVLDSRTSDICLGWNGTVVLWSANYFPFPPFHYNCRTTIIPYFKGQTEIPQGGFTWLKKQSARFQNDLIGPVRGDLLRNSGLTADEFRKASRDNQNDPITLDEMASKNKEIATRLQERKQSV